MGLKHATFTTNLVFAHFALRTFQGLVLFAESWLHWSAPKTASGVLHVKQLALYYKGSHNRHQFLITEPSSR